MPRAVPKDRGPANPLVVAVAYDGLSTFEFGCAVEVFGLPRPELGEPWYRFAVAAADPPPLRATGGFRMLADGGLDLLDLAGTIILPGWRMGPDAAPPPPSLLEALRIAHRRGARLMSLCSGVFVLAAAGLLDGRRATTHWWRHAETLALRHPEVRLVPDVLYVDDGELLTSAGGAAALDLCLHVVRRDFGPRHANAVARRLVVPPQREGGQAQYIDRPLPARGGSRLAGLLDLMRARIDEDWTIERLADAAAVSPRGLHRRFRAATGLAPGAWLLAERIARAKDLLESTDQSVEAIAQSVGFASAATLRLHFREKLGVTPSGWRLRAAVSDR